MNKLLLLYLVLGTAIIGMAQESPVLDNGQPESSEPQEVFPEIRITSFDSIPNEPKVEARFSYVKDTISYEEWIAIELRGNSSLRYPKKSYDLEIRVDSTSETSKDLQLGSMRSDDDWILNSVYNEPLKLRSYFSNQLWSEMVASRDTAGTRNGQAGIKADFVEVYLNDAYQGIYLLSEQVDRKLLKVKKMQGDTVRGLIYKAGSYADGTNFRKAETFSNALPIWSGFEMDYPYENFESHWEELYKFVDLVVNGNEKSFAATVNKELDLDNAIDYFIFINLLRATDNMGKNYFLARRDVESPFYLIPWDLDGVLGTIQDGKRISTTNDILTNGLFDRLFAENPWNYRERLKERWKALRAHELELDKMLERLRSIH
ncbi:MAG: CotH kinase family protein, partial [Bacteroidota bacterium]